MAKMNWKTIEDVKKVKEDELSRSCSESIAKGFYFEIRGTSYLFPYDLETQINFIGIYNLFQNNLIDTISCYGINSYEKVLIPMNKKEFNSLYFEGVKYNLENLRYYREDLKLKLSQATTFEEIHAIEF